MAGPRVDPKAETIDLRARSKKEFFLLHGYSGSPTDFNGLPKYLSARFNANVRVIRLKGHGERIENIDHLTYLDFLSQAEKELEQDLAKGKKIVVGGLSIGSFLALHLAARYPVAGVIGISTPYRFRPLMRLLSFFAPIIPKKHWHKPMSKEELRMRKDAFYYDANLNGVRVIKEGNAALDPVLKRVTAPTLFVQVHDEKIFHKKSAYLLREKIKSKIAQITAFKEIGYPNHNPFYTMNHEELYKIIGDFVEENKLLD